MLVVKIGCHYLAIIILDGFHEIHSMLINNYYCNTVYKKCILIINIL